MKRSIELFSLCSACILAAASTAFAAGIATPETDLLAGQAKASVAAFAGALKSELMSAMKAGGPVQAIDVCHSTAPAIAREISEQQGLQVSRVSQRNRNSENAPTGWQTAVLDDFQSRLEAGGDPDGMTWQEIADTGDGREFRFMKAITTQPLCLTCHGETVAPEVTQRLSELYPDDRATGFREGDLRGAFVVTRQLD
jgi:hypothetical protein